MHPINALDVLVTDIVTVLYQTVPFSDWRTATMFSKYTPDASVSSHDFNYLHADGKVDMGNAPPDDALLRLSKTTREHWRLTQDMGQPRWYKMIVTMERSGKFTVDFEYEDHYREGDIMKRG